MGGWVPKTGPRYTQAGLADRDTHTDYETDDESYGDTEHAVCYFSPYVKGARQVLWLERRRWMEGREPSAGAQAPWMTSANMGWRRSEWVCARMLPGCARMLPGSASSTLVFTRLRPARPSPLFES